MINVGFNSILKLIETQTGGARFEKRPGGTFDVGVISN